VEVMKKDPKGKKRPSLGKTLELSVSSKSENLGNSHLERNSNC
jgi:hypothetical protein